MKLGKTERKLNDWKNYALTLSGRTTLRWRLTTLRSRPMAWSGWSILAEFRSIRYNSTDSFVINCWKSRITLLICFCLPYVLECLPWVGLYALYFNFLLRQRQISRWVSFSRIDCVTLRARRAQPAHGELAGLFRWILSTHVFMTLHTEFLNFSLHMYLWVKIKPPATYKLLAVQECPMELLDIFMNVWTLTSFSKIVHQHQSRYVNTSRKCRKSSWTV